MLFKYQIYENIEKPKAEYEPFILKSSKDSYYYAKQILQRPWKKAEGVILEDPEFAYLYAKNVLKRRWKQAEELLLERCKDVDWGYWGQEKARSCATLYAIHVIKGRWREAEFYIAKDPNLGAYVNKLTDKEAKEFKNIITLTAMDDGKCAKKFFAWKPTHVVKIKGSRAFEIMLDEEITDRWGRPAARPDYGTEFQRAFTLKEWLQDGSVTSIEFCHDDNCWYWKRQVNYDFSAGRFQPIANWGRLEKERLAVHKLKGTVLPLA